MSIWWTIFKVSLEERLVYRGDFALGTFMRFLPIITQIFLWSAVFESLNPSDPSQARIAGFAFPDMVAYFLLTMVARAFSSMPGLASSIAKQIRDGEIKKFLVQPVDLLGYLFLSRLAHKVAYYTVATIPFAIVFYLCRDYFVHGWPDATRLSCFVASLVLAFVFGFFLEATLGLVGFWFLEVSSLLFVYMLLSFFLSGHMFPISILPEPYQSIVQFLPLKYLAYFPAAVFLGKVPSDELAFEMTMLVGWTAVFIVLSRVLYAAGLRRYSGYGG
ncbi:MAG: ABC-2 family transporter protein [Planctomycetota bacterium]|jgi:ABC-2 type transport system permease protein|nr:ABC-2 family transporter protein [Planctomycetota bacterium]